MALIENGRSPAVLLVAGSAAPQSHTRANIDHLEALLVARGATTYVWDIGKRPLPIHDPTYHRDPHMNPSANVRELAELANEADAFVLGTPVYHNGPSGALKNALDNLNMRHFADKPVALISNGGERSGVQPCDQLRVIVRGLNAVAIPSQIVTVSSDFEFTGGSYIITNKAIHDRFERMAEELLDYALLLRLRRAALVAR